MSRCDELDMFDDELDSTCQQIRNLVNAWGGVSRGLIRAIESERWDRLARDLERTRKAVNIWADLMMIERKD